MGTSENKKNDDPIITEVWAIKDALAKKHNYDLRSFFEASRAYTEQIRREGFRFSSPSDDRGDSPKTGTKD